MTVDEIKQRWQKSRDWQEMVAEIAVQLGELNANLRAIHPELNLPQECKEHKCSYYQHYLAHGPAELTHEGFHAAEEQGTNHYKNCDRCKSGELVCKTAENYEWRLRA